MAPRLPWGADSPRHGGDPAPKLEPQRVWVWGPPSTQRPAGWRVGACWAAYRRLVPRPPAAPHRRTSRGIRRGCCGAICTGRNGGHSRRHDDHHLQPVCGGATTPRPLVARHGCLAPSRHCRLGVHWTMAVAGGGAVVGIAHPHWRDHRPHRRNVHRHASVVSPLHGPAHLPAVAHSCATPPGDQQPRWSMGICPTRGNPRWGGGFSGRAWRNLEQSGRTPIPGSGLRHCRYRAVLCTAGRGMAAGRPARTAPIDCAGCGGLGMPSDQLHRLAVYLLDSHPHSRRGTVAGFPETRHVRHPRLRRAGGEYSTAHCRCRGDYFGISPGPRCRAGGHPDHSRHS